MSRRASLPALALSSALVLALAAPAASAQQDIDKVNGSIAVDAGSTHGDLGTVNGSIRIEDGATAGKAGTVNGSVRVGDDVTVRTLETVNGSIRVGERAAIADAVTTVNGSIFVDAGGRVGGGVQTVNGAIGLVRSEVGGDVRTVGGDVTVGVGSRVRGDLHVEKPSPNWLPISSNRHPPRIVIGPGAVVDGALVFEREVRLYVHESARTGAITGAEAIAFSTPSAPRD